MQLFFRIHWWYLWKYNRWEKWAISWLQNFSLETEFDLFKNKRTGETHFHDNGFPQRPIWYRVKWNPENSLLVSSHCSVQIQFVISRASICTTPKWVCLETCSLGFQFKFGVFPLHLLFSSSLYYWSFAFLTYFSVHGNWSSWSPWPNCNKPCNGGNKTRKRQCNNPEPAYGGEDCEGPATETDSCNMHSCPGVYFCSHFNLTNMQGIFKNIGDHSAQLKKSTYEPSSSSGRSLSLV